MKQRLIVSALAGAASIALLAPKTIHAQEVPPSDPPYQESSEEATEPTQEAIEEAPVTEENSATLPTVYNSPMTPANPTYQPVSAPASQTETAKVIVTPAVHSVSSMRLVSSLLVTLTPSSMRQSRIWSGF